MKSICKMNEKNEERTFLAAFLRYMKQIEALNNREKFTKNNKKY